MFYNINFSSKHQHNSLLFNNIKTYNRKKITGSIFLLFFSHFIFLLNKTPALHLLATSHGASAESQNHWPKSKHLYHHLTSSCHLE